jgi:hypothetical protein
MVGIGAALGTTVGGVLIQRLSYRASLSWTERGRSDCISADVVVDSGNSVVDCQESAGGW